MDSKRADSRRPNDVTSLNCLNKSTPPNVLKQLISHPLTDNGLKAFLDDWKMTGQSIA